MPDGRSDYTHWFFLLTILAICVNIILTGYYAHDDTVTAKVPLKFPTEGCAAVLTTTTPNKDKPHEMIWYNQCELEKP